MSHVSISVPTVLIASDDDRRVQVGRWTFVVTVAIVRLGHKRMSGNATAFDLVVAIMVGSVMSRATA